MPLVLKAEIGCNQTCTDDLAPEGGYLTCREVCLVCNRAVLFLSSRNAMDQCVHAPVKIALSERSVSAICCLQCTRPVCALFRIFPYVRVLHDIPFPPIQPDVQAMLTVLADLAHMHTVDPTATLVILRASQHDVAATARTAIAIDVIHLVVQHLIISLKSRSRPRQSGARHTPPKRSRPGPAAHYQQPR